MAGRRDRVGSYWRQYLAISPFFLVFVGFNLIPVFFTLYLAFQVITWLLDADNQGRGFTDASLFPSAPAAYKLPALTSPDPFFGNQVTIDVFGPAAEKIPIAYEAPADAAVAAPYYNEIIKVETGKDANQAWNDAVSQAKQIAQKQGVN